MAIKKIDYEKCVGCGRCMQICSCDVIRMNKDNRPVIKYPTECIVCLYCEEECPAGAIFVSPEKYYKQLQSWG